MKKFKGLLMSSMAVFVLAACGGDTATEDPVVEDPGEEEVVEDEAAEDVAEDAAEDTEGGSTDTDSEAITGTQQFTMEDLSEYDGKDGSPAYVAVEGVVYDVTDSEAWNEGEHAGEDLAGTDATDVITESPHGEAVLADLPVVGNLTE